MLSVGLSAMMIAGMVSPAYAAANTHDIEVFLNGSSTPAQRIQVQAGAPVEDLKIFEQGATALDGIQVKSGSYTHDESEKFDGLSGVLPNGTKYTFSVQNTNNADTLYLSTSNIVDDMEINLDTTESSYTVTANSGDYGVDNNHGSTTPTCTVTDEGMVVTGGESMSLTFTPNAGKEIESLNIRTGYSNKANLIEAKNGSVTVEGLTFEVSKLSDGSVSVSCQNVTRDLFITALTKAKATEYALSVKTDGHVTSDVTSGKLYSDKASSVVFTPDQKYSVYKFVITQGANQKTVYATDSSVTIGNSTYTISRNLSGQVTVGIPKAVADVTIEAVSTFGSYSVSVSGSKYVDSNYDELGWIGYGEDATVVLTPDKGYNIEYISIVMGDGSTKVSSNETAFRLNGRSYRMEKDRNGVVYLYLKDLSADVLITPSVEDTMMDVSVSADSGIYCSDSGTNRVQSGDVFQTTFEPKNNCIIEKIEVTRNGKTYTADKSDSFIVINDVRCPISWQYNGKVTITLYDIDADMKVKATSDYNSGRRTITKKPDSHSTITHDAKNSSYANVGEEVNVTVSPDKNYTLSTVKISTSTDSVTIYTNTNRFVLNNRAYYVTHKSNGDWVINFSSLPASVTISSSTVRDTIDLPTDPSVNGYHSAYLYGIGNGKFDPERNMTRAEAVTMLARLYYNANVTGYTSTSVDVPRNAWYSSYIGWAQANGILTNYGYFRPMDNITRAEFVDLLCKFSQANTNGFSGYNIKFSDINYYWIQNNYSLAEEIAYASSQGWIYGYQDGTFRPNNFIRRSEVVTMTNRATNRVPDKQYIFTNMNLMKRFSDVPVSHWAFYDIMEATNGHYYNNYTGYESWGSYR